MQQIVFQQTLQLDLTKKWRLDKALQCKCPSYLTEGGEGWPIYELNGNYSESLEVNVEKEKL